MSRKVKVFKCSECKFESSLELFKEEDKTVKCPRCNELVENNTTEMDFGKGLSIREYCELLGYINKHHAFGRLTGNGKQIKYISNKVDMRTGTIFSISLDNVEFTNTNENRHRNLKDWIYEYLNN